MLQHKENCGLIYTITLENHLEYVSLNANNVKVHENMVALFYNALSTAVFM
jgi:hypothetical protein